MAAVQLPKKIVAPHFVDSFPFHEAVLPEAPPQVVLNFNFNLHQDSRISLTRDGQEVSLGPAAVSEGQLSMRSSLVDDSGDGVYQINYRACWPDGSCAEGGSTAFVADRRSSDEYEDLRGQSEVTVHMTEGNRFDSARMIISPGTKVNWINDDLPLHFVNSDPHPSHNLDPGLNSKGIASGEGFSFTFEELGVWGYHCSAHVNLGMRGQVLVK